MKPSFNTFVATMALVFGLITFYTNMGTAGEPGKSPARDREGSGRQIEEPADQRMENPHPSLAETAIAANDTDICADKEAEPGVLFSGQDPVQTQPRNPVLLAAVGTEGGPPPCGQDGICNMAACSDDPDCPEELPQNTNDGSGGSQHNEGGIGHSVWMTTGEDGFEGGHYCPPGGTTCDIMVHWSVTPDKYDKWKICWKDYGDTFTNACDVNQKIRKFENNFYQIPNLKVDHHYRLRLEGRKDKNDKWKCLAKARLRNVHLNGTNIGSVLPCVVP